MAKNTPFFPIFARFCNPKHVNDVRAYTARSWKTILITWFFPLFYEDDIQLQIQVTPGHSYIMYMLYVMTLLLNEILKYSAVYNLNNFMYQTNRVRKERYKDYVHRNFHITIKLFINMKLNDLVFTKIIGSALYAYCNGHMMVDQP